MTHNNLVANHRTKIRNLRRQGNAFLPDTARRSRAGLD